MVNVVVVVVNYNIIMSEINFVLNLFEPERKWTDSNGKCYQDVR